MFVLTYSSSDFVNVRAVFVVFVVVVVAVVVSVLIRQR